jgi:adenylate kinase
VDAAAAPEPLHNPAVASAVAIVGKPGSGKSTIGHRLAEYFGAVYIGTGSLLRERAREHDRLGIEVDELLGRGSIVPDDIVLEVFTRELERSRPERVVLDGIPRTAAQMRAVDSGRMPTRLDLVLYLHVAETVAAERLRDRSAMAPRADDAVAAHRVEVLLPGMLEIVELAAEWGILATIDGNHGATEVLERCCEELRRRLPGWAR